MFSLNVWNLKNKMNEYNKSRNKLRYIDQTSGLPVGRGVRGRTDRGKDVWDKISYKDIIYDTEYSHYFIIPLNVI